nr:(2Fe-2S)-binding protein [Corynebacterium mendelii]
MGFTPRVDDGADGDDPAVWHRAGRELAASLGPLVECLCEHAGLRPGPLWAIVGDGLSGAAAAAGNHAFDPYRGVHVGLELNRGLADGVGGSVVLPPPRFIDVCDGVIRATDTAAAEKGVDSPDVHTAIRRNSCCMIYHNPSSDKCVSCPKKTPAEKDRDLLAYVSSMEP